MLHTIAQFYSIYIDKYTERRFFRRNIVPYGIEINLFKNIEFNQGNILIIVLPTLTDLHSIHFCKIQKLHN